MTTIQLALVFVLPASVTAMGPLTRAHMRKLDETATTAITVAAIVSLIVMLASRRPLAQAWPMLSVTLTLGALTTWTIRDDVLAWVIGAAGLPLATLAALAFLPQPLGALMAVETGAAFIRAARHRPRQLARGAPAQRVPVDF